MPGLKNQYAKLLFARFHGDWLPFKVAENKRQDRASDTDFLILTFLREKGKVLKREYEEPYQVLILLALSLVSKGLMRWGDSITPVMNPLNPSYTNTSRYQDREFDFCIKMYRNYSKLEQ